MTIEAILLFVVVFLVGIKAFVSAPQKAFTESGPKLAARVEKHLVTGRGFSQKRGLVWKAERQ